MLHGDGGSDGAQEPEYRTLNDAKNWTTFAMPDGAGGFGGGILAGNRLIVVPLARQQMPFGSLRSYDTTMGFDDTAAWESFDLKTVNPGATGYFGAAFDGRYVYFAPYSTSLLARWDSQKSFTDPSAYQFHDLGQTGMLTAGFDGHSLYLVPFYNGTTHQPIGKIVRYDVSKSFDMGNSYTSFDLSTKNANAKNFVGAVFDGTYLYLSPGAFGVTARFQVAKPIDEGDAWDYFSVSTLCASCQAYEGAAFDGRYVYFAPSARDDGSGLLPKSTAVRLDTKADFTKNNAWDSFDMKTVHPAAAGYSGVGFDGRYAYYAPSDWSVTGIIMRFDTTLAFSQGSSWTPFDVASVNPKAYGFKGVVFDGKYMYFVPFSNGAVARFDARAVKKLPKESSASTY
jgi:hypothetical protein